MHQHYSHISFHKGLRPGSCVSGLGFSIDSMIELYRELRSQCCQTQFAFRTRAGHGSPETLCQERTPFGLLHDPVSIPLPLLCHRQQGELLTYRGGGKLITHRT
eukprot:793807-Amphidinium_carterae.4